MPGRGNSITIKEKEMIIEIKHFFDKEKKKPSNVGVYNKSAVALTAIASNFSEVAVSRIVTEYNKHKSFEPPATKGSQPYAVDESVKTICQEVVRSHNINRDHLSIRRLVGILNDQYNIDVARETLRINLSRWNIVYGSVLRHTALREKDYVVNARRDYLIRKRQLDKSGRTLVYLDETFINKNYCGPDLSWFCDDWEEDPNLDKSFGPYINRPSGKGDRLIILNAVTKNGWVDGTKLVFQAKNNSGDYHGSMDEVNFTRWFTEQLLPNIPDKSVIIMDNAPYHNMYKDDGTPSLSSKKTVLQEWLKMKGIPYDKEFLRPKLIEIINKNRQKKEFKLDDILANDPRFKGRNIEIVRTPQYHPELQPIEKCWAVIKQYMAKHCDFTMKGLRKNLDNAWEKVTKKTMKGIMKKVRESEDYHFEQDAKLDSVDDAECM